MRITILFLFSIVINNINCYYVLPLKTYYDYNSTDKDRTRIMHNLITNNIYTELEIANPPQKLATFIKSKDYCSYIANYLCNIDNSNYDPTISSDFNNTTPYDLNFKEFKNASLANEKMKFSTNYKDLSKLEEVDFKQFYHAPNNTYASDRPNTCGVFGFRNKFDKKQEGEDKCISLINGLYNDSINLNSENDTNNLVFSIDYSKEELIIGGYPHEYNPSMYKESNFTKIYMNESYMEGNNDFHITFEEVYFYKDNKQEISDNKIRIIDQGFLHSIFIVEQNMIMVPIYFFNLFIMNFFRKYINIGYCETVQTDLGKYESIICEKENFNSTEELEFKNTFPTVFFFHFGFNTTFGLTFNELVHENNGRLYFMMYTDSENYYNYWGIGKLFMEKYLFTFDFGSQTIGYYNETYLRKEFDFIENGIYVLIIIGLNILVAISCLLYCIIHKCTKSSIDPTIMIDSFSAGEKLKENTEEKTDL